MRALAIGLLAAAVHGEPVSPLYLRGYTVIPEPQRVELKGADFVFDAGWRIDSSDPGAAILREQLAERFGVTLAGHGSAVEIAIKPGAVTPANASDPDKSAIAEQAYRLELAPSGIQIIANASAGVFYGVETLVQLITPEKGKLRLPEAVIVDWPDVSLREVFWDEQMHLDHFDVLKQAVRRAAFFKANALSLRLNGHFEYSSAPALVDPSALSPAKLQELTDYGLRYHLQVIPYLDGPAHANFILEREEYKKLREFPETAFEMCSTNPGTYRLLEGMFQDLMDANKGGKYFHLSTDEAWFIGKAAIPECNEAARAKELGSPSDLWVEFVRKTAGYLQAHGRRVIFWGEDPLKADDIRLLPPGLINGEVYSSAYNAAFRAHGISQMIYTNSLPDDPLFPFYFVLAPHEQVHPRAADERATTVFNEISYTSARAETVISGAGVYAWADLGPHPETYWLGYAVGASAAWHPGAPDPHELAHRFYRIFYGQGAREMGRVYQLMSTQAQFWATSWDSRTSGTVPLIFGYSYGIGPFTPHIATLPLPRVPGTDMLHLDGDWARDNARRLELAETFLGENEELENLLYANLQSVEFNRYNLEVYLSIAKLFRQNLRMLEDLGAIHAALERAREQAEQLHYTEATAALDQALDKAGKIRDERNQALADVTATWYRSWFPRVREANGRHAARNPQSFVDMETSDAARRAQEGMVYLIDREFALPLGDWFNQLQDVRNRYAAAHKLSRRESRFDWQDAKTLHSQAVNREL